MHQGLSARRDNDLVLTVRMFGRALIVGPDQFTLLIKDIMTEFILAGVQTGAVPPSMTPMDT